MCYTLSKYKLGLLMLGYKLALIEAVEIQVNDVELSPLKYILDFFEKQVKFTSISARIKQLVFH